jgi:hypothetical protein
VYTVTEMRDFLLLASTLVEDAKEAAGAEAAWVPSAGCEARAVSTRSQDCLATFQCYTNGRITREYLKQKRLRMQEGPCSSTCVHEGNVEQAVTNRDIRRRLEG